jgi:hypothetical protein
VGGVVAQAAGDLSGYLSELATREANVAQLLQAGFQLGIEAVAGAKKGQCDEQKWNESDGILQRAQQTLDQDAQYTEAVINLVQL